MSKLYYIEASAEVLDRGGTDEVIENMGRLPDAWFGNLARVLLSDRA